MRRRSMLGLVMALLMAGCLESREESPSCGGGEAYRYGSGWYCIYTGPIIIEGFLCPESMPHQFIFEGEAMGFGEGSAQVGLCAPAETPPDGGWREVFEQWKRDGGQVGPRPDASGDVASDTSGPDVVDPDADTGGGDGGPDGDTGAPVDVSEPPCETGIGLEGCWSDAQCPADWNCAGVSPGCTVCESCGEATLGVCYTSMDALGLIWRGGERVALWAVAQVYTLVPCPALTLESAPSADGPWTVVGPELGCEATVVPPYASSIPRTLPALNAGLWARVRGTLKTGCFSEDPAECQGELELVSPPLAPQP